MGCPKARRKNYGTKQKDMADWQTLKIKDTLASNCSTMGKRDTGPCNYALFLQY
jgi:hypothetical protein